MPHTNLRKRLNDEPPIRPGRCYLCVGPNGAWGKAFTPRQAWENAQCPSRVLMYDAPPDVTVDRHGSIQWLPDLYAGPLRFAATLLYSFPEEVLREG